MSDDNVAMEANEQREHATHAETRHPIVLRASICIAVLAVLSSGISSLVANESASATSASSEAVLHQDRATDSWNFFQAKTIKATLYELAAQRGGSDAGANRQEGARQRSAVDGIQRLAQTEERLSTAASADAERHERRHHILDLSETLSHIAIAIATVAIITRQRWPLLSSIVLGVVSLGIAAVAYLGGP